MLDDLRAHFNSGKLRGYSGTRPTDADTALSGNTLLFELTFNATAFPAASSGVITANAITSNAAAASGTLSFCRLVKSDGTTVIGDISVGVGSGELQVSTLTITATVNVSCSSFTITAPVGT